jgi:hypothetical protein
VIRKDPVAVLGPDCLQNTNPSWPCIWRIIYPIRILRTFRSSLVHLAVGPLRAIGDDQSRGCDIPTGPCSQSIGNNGSFIIESNQLLAQISALASGSGPSREELQNRKGSTIQEKVTPEKATRRLKVRPHPSNASSSKPVRNCVLVSTSPTLSRSGLNEGNMTKPVLYPLSYG